MYQSQNRAVAVFFIKEKKLVTHNLRQPEIFRHLITTAQDVKYVASREIGTRCRSNDQKI